MAVARHAHLVPPAADLVLGAALGSAAALTAAFVYLVTHDSWFAAPFGVMVCVETGLVFGLVRWLTGQPGAAAWAGAATGVSSGLFAEATPTAAVPIVLVECALIAATALVAGHVSRGSRSKLLPAGLLLLVPVGLAEEISAGGPGQVLAVVCTAVACLVVRRATGRHRSARRVSLVAGTAVVLLVALDLLPSVGLELPRSYVLLVVLVMALLLAGSAPGERDPLRKPLLAGLGYGALCTLYATPQHGLVVGVAIGLVVELAVRRQAGGMPARGLRLSRRGLAISALVALVAGLLRTGPYDVAVAGLFGLVIGVVVSLVHGVEAPRDLTSIRGPAEVPARDRAASLVSVLAVAPAVGIATGVISDDGGLGLLGGLTYGVATGVLVATVRTRWPHHLVTRCAPALTGRAPWRLMAFLRDAHTVHGVLRQNGATYQFRHLDVQRRLAATSAPPGTAGAPAATPPG